ncbi:UNVERIFIED_CONTAM: hypothetical protein Slati_1475700 [Sesamum latifolium]|uniref:Uncharacterized protein n=1 Tax=Sesamum latifolium TaxID=2727402 RepID=A0AAW2X5S8_9LAMI
MALLQQYDERRRSGEEPISRDNLPMSEESSWRWALPNWRRSLWLKEDGGAVQPLRVAMVMALLYRAEKLFTFVENW